MYVKCHNALDCEYRYLHLGTALLPYQIEESKLIDDWENSEKNVTNASSCWLRKNVESVLEVNAKNRKSEFYQDILNAELALDTAEEWLASDLRKTLKDTMERLESALNIKIVKKYIKEDGHLFIKEILDKSSKSQIIKCSEALIFSGRINIVGALKPYSPSEVTPLVVHRPLPISESIEQVKSVSQPPEVYFKSVTPSVLPTETSSSLKSVPPQP